LKSSITRVDAYIAFYMMASVGMKVNPDGLISKRISVRNEYVGFSQGGVPFAALSQPPPPRYLAQFSGDMCDRVQLWNGLKYI
jgi:hypothetical protein